MTLIIDFKDYSHPFVHVSDDIEVIFNHITLHLQSGIDNIDRILIVPGNTHYLDYIPSNERDSIEHDLMSGVTIDEVLNAFPHYNRHEIECILQDIARFYWYSDEEWEAVQEWPIS